MQCKKEVNLCLIENRAIYSCEVYGSVWPALRLGNFAPTERAPGKTVR
jgi:hypothetical protein